MQRRGFLILLGATVVLVVLALVAALGGDRNVVRVAPNERALPGLGPKLGDLAWLRLTHGATKINFAQIGGQWALVEKGNYPANQGKIRQLLLGLADLTLIEAKTERSELFSRIGLDDPSNGNSTLISVQDRSGANVGELILGKRKLDRLGGGNDGVYVRKPGSDRTWLARGTVEAGGEPVSWIDRRVIDIPEKRIASVKLTGADGAAVTLKRDKPEAGFTIENPPADTVSKADMVLAKPAGALEAVDLDDVKPTAELPVPDHDVATATLTTFDGLSVEVFLFERDGVNWAVFDVSGTGGAEAEAKTVADKVSRWSYAIPAVKANALRTKLADLVEPPKPS
jgi:hypothetical protein